MPTTPKLALPYPITADTADVPRDVQALATAVEASSLIVPTATALPVGSFDGQLIDILVPGGPRYAGQIIWRFRYRPASTNPNKWEFVGGPPLQDFVNSVVSAGELTNVPKATLPFTGDYNIRYGAQIKCGAAGQGATARLVYSGTGTGIGLSSLIVQGSGGSAAAQVSANPAVEERVDAVLNAADVLALSYSGTAGAGIEFSRAFLSVVPVRVR